MFEYHLRGFGPERRGPFVSVKGPKTSDAPSGLMKVSWTRTRGGRTNSRGSSKVRRFMRVSPQGAGRQASVSMKEQNGRGGLQWDKEDASVVMVVEVIHRFWEDQANEVPEVGIGPKGNGPFGPVE